jgi:hypothetical protein
MSSDASEIHICVRCGHANDGEASFCVECGFDLSSALQRDYDSYRDVSRGEGTISESDAIPVSVIRTLTGMTSAGDGLPEELGGEPTEPPAPAVAKFGFSQLEDPDEPAAVDSDEEEVETRLELEGIVAPAGHDVFASGVEVLEMEQINDLSDPFAPITKADLDSPKSRPVHENLRPGVTTYVHASERGFRRTGSPIKGNSLAISIGGVLAIGSVIFVLILILTR